METLEEEFIPVRELAGYRLWHLLQKARFFDRESRAVVMSQKEEEAAWVGFCERHKIDAVSTSPIPQEYFGCGPLQLREAAVREARISKWKEAEFGPHVEGYFEQQKGMLEKVVYSLIRVREAGIASELWFRIHEGEASFAELAPAHAGGAERLTGGIIGPVALGTAHPALAERLRTSREGELLKPFAVGGWHLVVRLDKRIPAVLDGQMRAGILEELSRKRMEEYERHGN